ncbi:MAG: hypothetical protein LAQ30_30695, partial [Acidobacteriia bacterium]|nr:hypothetical protein [Terriglobia bacterium]
AQVVSKPKGCRALRGIDGPRRAPTPYLFIVTSAGRTPGLLHVFDPEVLIVGGHVTDAGEDLLVPLQAELWERTRGLLGRDVPVLPQQVADKSGIVAAAGLAMAPRP